MADIVNLRQARKRRQRDDARRKGDAAAARHGLSKAEKTRRAAEDAIETRRLDGHRLEKSGEDDPEGAPGPEDGPEDGPGDAR